MTVGKSVFWMTVATAVPLAGQFLLILVLARAFGADEVGRYTFAQALTAPVILICQMQLREALAARRLGNLAYGDYLKFRVGLAALALMVAPIVAVVSGSLSSVGIGLLMAVATSKVADSVSDVTYAFLQREGLFFQIALSNILRSFASMISAVGVLLATKSIETSLWIAAAISVICSCFWDARRAVNLPGFAGPRPGIGHFKPLLKELAPLAAAAGLVSISGNLPRYMLKTFASLDQVGIYAVGASLLAPIGMVQLAFSQATISSLSQLFHKPDRTAFRQRLLGVAGLQALTTIVAVVAISVAAEPFFRLAFGERFTASFDVARILGFFYVAGAAFFLHVIIFNITGRYSMMLVGTVIGFAFQIPLHAYLIPRFGSTGAAWAEVGRTLGTCVILAPFAYREVRRRQDSGEAPSEAA